jgi:hypothetical protein
MGGKGPGPSGHGLGQGDDKIGIVVARVQVMGPEIYHLMARGAALAIDFSFKPNLPVAIPTRLEKPRVIKRPP